MRSACARAPPHPSHLICARCPSPETALGKAAEREPREKGERRALRNVGKEFTVQQEEAGERQSKAYLPSVAWELGGLLLGFRPSFKPRHMGCWQMSWCPLLRADVRRLALAGLFLLLTPSPSPSRGRVCFRIQVSGVRWLFGFEGVGGAFSEDDRVLLLPFLLPLL